MRSDDSQVVPGQLLVRSARLPDGTHRNGAILSLSRRENRYFDGDASVVFLHASGVIWSEISNQSSITYYDLVHPDQEISPRVQ